MTAEIIKFNLEGEICPYTLIRTIKKVEELKEGLETKEKILEVIYDHPPVVDNIPAEFQKRSFQVEVREIGTAKWRIIIKK